MGWRVGGGGGGMGGEGGDCTPLQTMTYCFTWYTHTSPAPPRKKVSLPSQKFYQENSGWVNVRVIFTINLGPGCGTTCYCRGDL